MGNKTEFPNGGVCPACHERMTGALGASRWFCSHCYVEIEHRAGVTRLWRSTAAGKLLPLRRAVDE